MKTLANCNPREFLRQTAKIRTAVKDWLDLTKILEIRKHTPNVDPASVSKEEYKAEWDKQAKKNLQDMLAVILDEYPDESADLLCLLCFVDPANAENVKMTEIMASVTEILNSPEVLDFFRSLMSLEQTDILNASKR